MANWKDVLTRIAVDAETQMDELRYRLHYQLGGLGPVKIVTYRGYGTPERLYFRGRVLEDPRIGEAEKNDKIWENLLNMYRRLESDEVPHARLVARFQGIEQEVQADEEGFFEVTITPREPLTPDRLWHAVEVQLLDPIPAEQSRYPVKAVAEVLVPSPKARLVVVSDIDDTVLHADATHMLRMARNVFLGNAHTRLAFPGVAALYRALFAGQSGAEMNPLFYVSSSPWNLYDLLAQFFNLHNIPVGPVLFLRDWGLTEEEILPLRHKEYKLSTIRHMLDYYPDLPFILLGDSGQEDPEIYADIVSEYPGRILAVYIRNVSRGLDRPESVKELAKRVVEAGSALVLADDSLAIARHAAEHGYIRPETLPLISENKQKDEQPPTPLEKMLGEPVKKEAPTVEISAREAKDGGVEDAVKHAGDTKSKQPPTVVVEGDESKNRKKNK